MKISTIIFLFFFSLNLLSRADLLSFIKKIKSPIELSSTEDYDENSDLDESKKTSDAKEDEKNAHYITFNSAFVFFKDIRHTKHFLDQYRQLFKSHFKEVVCPPPESIV